MILRRLTEALRRQDWLTVLLEIVIVVPGVFIGIQVANWNEERTNREVAARHVAEIAEDIPTRHGGGCPGCSNEFRIEPMTKIGAIVLTSAIGSGAGLYASQAFELIAPAIEKVLPASGDAPKRIPEFARNEGIYRNISGQAAVVRWDAGVAVLGQSNRTSAESLGRFEHVEGATFRGIRNGDDTGRETLRFELGPYGEVTRFQRHRIHMERIEP